MKDVTDPQWEDDADVTAWVAWTKENMPGAELSDENIMAPAANLRNFRVGLLLPESRINASPNDYKVITYMKLQRFNGATWDCVD